MSSLFDQIASIESEVSRGLASLRTFEELKQFKAKYLGRSGSVTDLLKMLRSLEPALRPEAGKKINDLKSELETKFADLESSLVAGEVDKALKELVDITLPGRGAKPGRIHPVVQTMKMIEEVFLSLGFSIHEGSEIETDWYNFEALNTPPDHPSRDMQDTFYVMPLFCSAVMRSDSKTAEQQNSKTEFLLRTHTSPVQIHVMEKFKPPLKMIFPGAVYRRDADLSHSPMFHQVEGLMVGSDVTMANLKGVLTAFLHKVFGEKVGVRFRPSFFPFTEPSAEVDIECFNGPCRVCKGTGWMEIMGCGMVDPNVFKAVGYDPKKVTGFAFGMGVERIAMLKFGISDIRMFYENDVRFLEQF